MKTSNKLLIDRVVGLPLVVVLNQLARVAGKLLNRDHSATDQTVKKIVVAKFVGMGSILQATPMMEGLKKKFPNAEIVFLTSKSNRALMDRLDPIDRTICIDESGIIPLGVSTIRALWQLVGEKVDLYFDLEVYSAYACLMSALSLARNRYGFYRTSAWYKMGLHTHLMYFNTRRPVRRIYHQLGRMAGISEWENGRVSKLRTLESDVNGYKVKFPDLKPGFVVINPNASDLLLERRWPLDRFAKLTTELVAEGKTVVFVGSPNETAWVRELEGLLDEKTRSQTVNTSGKLKLPELFALLENAGCVVTNDTGPMHMAVALERPTVCLFGPVDPAHYGFQDEPFVETIYHPVYCSPCVHEADSPPCNGNNVCMQMLQVKEVKAAIDRLLAGNGNQRSKQPRVEYSDQQCRPLGMELAMSLEALK